MRHTKTKGNWLISFKDKEFWINFTKPLKAPITTAADDKHFSKFSTKIRYDITWESSASRRFSWNVKPYLLFSKRLQNLQLSAANYRWRFQDKHGMEDSLVMWHRQYSHWSSEFWKMGLQYNKSYIGWKVKGQSWPFVLIKGHCLIRLNISSKYYDFCFNSFRKKHLSSILIHLETPSTLDH